MSIVLHQVEVFDVETSKEEILDILSNFYDEDFCGNNGTDYNWIETDEGGYNSNQQYVLATIRESDIVRPLDIIQKYFDMWLGRDNYYDATNIDITSYGSLLIVSVVATHDD